VAETRSPLKDKPLRNPGQSVREQRLDFAYDKVLAPALVAFVMLYVAGTDWFRYFFPLKSIPWITTLLALGAIGYAVWQFLKYWPKVQAMKLAEDGEKAVGQHLEGLRASGYSVFHDLIGDGFNVDHVIIGPAGVFTIETKAWSKPAKGSAEITFDGESLRVAGREPDRNPVIQAKAQANWLRQILAESTGKTFSVWPVVLFPGWFVKNSREGFKDLWVLEPKAFAKLLANEQVKLAPEDISLTAFHLSQFIRSQERAAASKR
jgi:Nuclease-related domain